MMKSEYRVQQKKWIQRTKEKLDVLDESLSRLERTVSDAAADASEEIRSKLADARAELDGWRGRWTKAKDAASDVWEAISEEVGTAWEASRGRLETSLKELETALEVEGTVPPSAQDGDTVVVHYHGRLEDGTEFQTTRGRDPIEFTLGEGRVVPGVEKAVEGMRVGEKASAEIAVEDGFGPHDPDLVIPIARDAFEGEDPPALGDKATVRLKDGEPVLVTVRSVRDDVVEVDANHPLAGHALHMDLELIAIK